MSEASAAEAGGSAEGPIVVGVDGSEPSLDALRWAGTQAQATGQELVAVITWEWPKSYGAMTEWPEGVDFEADARHVLADSVEKVLGAATETTQRVLQGSAAPLLREMSESASLIVVGNTGHGEFSGMLLGSVSQYLTTHSHCPVVIVRGKR